VSRILIYLAICHPLISRLVSIVPLISRLVSIVPLISRLVSIVPLISRLVSIVHVLGAYETRDSPTTSALLEQKWDIIFFTGP
jgi:hypothetical protein